MIISVPMSIMIGKRKKKSFSFNMNTYRNAYFHQLNTAKVMFKELVTHKLKHIPNFEYISLVYTVYPKTRRRIDVANVCSVVDKFFSDALVEAGKLPDDNYLFLPEVVYRFGHIDKHNPRVEIEIIDLHNPKYISNNQDDIDMQLILKQNEIQKIIGEATIGRITGDTNTTVVLAVQNGMHVAVVASHDDPILDNEDIVSAAEQAQTQLEPDTAASQPVADTESEKPSISTGDERVDPETPSEPSTEEVLASNMGAGEKTKVLFGNKAKKAEPKPEEPVASARKNPFGSKEQSEDDPVEEEVSEPEEEVAEEPTKKQEAPAKKPLFNFQRG